MRRKVRDTDWDAVQKRLYDFTQLKVSEENHVYYIAGMGGVSKNTYLTLQTINGLNVLRVEQFEPNSIFQKLLSIFMSSYWGVLKINDLSTIYRVFDELTEQAMAGLYILSKKDEDTFISQIQSVKSPLEISDYVEQLTDFFMYQVDTDNDESETGIVEIISYGSNCPKSLTEVVELTYFR